MCKRYGVSMTTAVRAVNILKDRGILQAIPKKGTYIKGVPEIGVKAEKIAPLKSIRLVCPQENLDKISFPGEIYQGILQACGKKQLPLLTEHINTRDLRGMNKLSFTPHPEEGIIVVSGMPEICQQALLGSQGLRRVLVDSIVPNSPCVLSDSFDGIHQILQHLKELGHTHIGFAGAVVDSPNTVNENERRGAFQNLSQLLELQGEMLEQTSISGLIDMLKKNNHPSAIVFTRDDPALQFIAEAEKAGIRVPDDICVTGYDDKSLMGYSLDNLTTCRVDCVEMGKQAVECLYNFDNNSEMFCRWHRVHCQLIIRNSTKSF